MILFYIRHGEPIYNPDQLTPHGHEQAEALGKRGQVRLHKQVDGRDERRDDHDVARNMDGAWNHAAERADKPVGTDKHERRRQAHAERVLKRRGDRKRRTETEHQAKRRVVLEYSVPEC